jgi:hypothetical protein
MSKRRTDFLLESLALDVAMGKKVAPWAKSHDVGLRTAREWTARPEFKVLVRKYRNRVVDRVIGQHVKAAEAATTAIRALMKTSKNEAIVLATAKDLRDVAVNMVSSAEIERRLEALEARYRDADEQV